MASPITQAINNARAAQGGATNLPMTPLAPGSAAPSKQLGRLNIPDRLADVTAPIAQTAFNPGGATGMNMSPFPDTKNGLGPYHPNPHGIERSQPHIRGPGYVAPGGSVNIPWQNGGGPVISGGPITPGGPVGVGGGPMSTPMGVPGAPGAMPLNPGFQPQAQLTPPWQQANGGVNSPNTLQRLYGA